MPVAGVAYCATDGITWSALQFKSTIIPMVIDGIEFYGLLLLNVSVFVSCRMGWYSPADYHLNLPFFLCGATGSLMTFFVCFYNSHVFSRYQKLYHITKQMSENTLAIVSLLRVVVADIRDRRRIAKLLLASCLMFFFERTEGLDDNDDDVDISDLEFKQVEKLGLLGPSEVAHLKRHCDKMRRHGIPSFLVLQWAMEVMRMVTPEPTGRDDMLYGFYAGIYRVRRCQAEVIEILELPMPFQYFHIMNFMIALNLILWAYALGCQTSYFAPLIFCFVQMMFQGMRELASALSDPFGSDEVDFPINVWMVSIYSRIYGILEDPYKVSSINLKSVRPLLEPSKAMDAIGKIANQKLEDSGPSGKIADYQAVRQQEHEEEDEEDALLESEEEE